MNIQQKNINWLNVIFNNNITQNSITFLILVKIWAYYETRDENWISHFIEHMFFNWWKKYKTSKEVSQLIDKLGWSFNAFTSDEKVGYYVKVAPEFSEIAIEVLSDMLIDSTFLESEIEKEKNVITQEIKMYEDDPRDVLSEKRKLSYYWDNNFWRPIIWTVDNINNFDRNKLIDFKDKFYHKKNTYFIVSWNILNQNILEENLNKYFKNYKNNWDIISIKYEQNQIENKLMSFNKKTEQNHLILSLEWFNTNHEKSIISNVLSVVLWWNMSSRLFQTIREKYWLAYYIYCYHDDNLFNWAFKIVWWIEKEKFQKWIDEITNEIDQISKWNIDKEEFDRAMWFIKWKLKLGLESSDDIAFFLWDQIINKWYLEDIEQIIKKYEEVNLDELNEFAKILNKNNFFGYYVY